MVGAIDQRVLQFVASMQNLVASAVTMQNIVLQLITRNRRLKNQVLLSSGDLLRTGWRSGVKKAKMKRIVKHWVRPGRTSTWWDNLVGGKMVDEEWYENFAWKI